MNSNGSYYEQFYAGRDRWSPVWAAEKPCLDGNRIKRTTGVGPIIRCLQPVRITHNLHDRPGRLHKLYSPEAENPACLHANRREGLVELDVKKEPT